MNPANEIKKKANKLRKTYWEYLNNKGFVHNFIHNEIEKLEAYKLKCQERRNSRGDSSATTS